MISLNKGGVFLYIKQFAAKYHLSSDTFRFYEKDGLLHPQRLANGYRFYDTQCEKNIKLIHVLKKLGFSLQEIKALILLGNQQISDACNLQTSHLFATKRTVIQQKIEFYTVALEALQQAEDLIGEGKYEENKTSIEQAIENMYSKMDTEQEKEHDDAQMDSI